MVLTRGSSRAREERMKFAKTFYVPPDLATGAKTKTRSKAAPSKLITSPRKFCFEKNPRNGKD
jgi:hypothetical protein